MKAAIRMAAVSGLALAAACAACAAQGEARARTARRPAAPSGGLVERAGAGLAVRVADAQRTLPHAMVEAAARGVRLRSLLRVEASAPADAPSGAEGCLRLAASEARADGAGAAVLVADCPSLPLVVASPDGRWAVANVSSLAGCPPDVAAARLSRLLWNAAARAIGAGGSGHGGGVLAPFRSAGDLDALPDVPGPMQHNALMDAASACGIGRVTVATYRAACAQGWAPEPTNAVQQAIWDEVRSGRERGPARALRIVP